MLTMDSLHVDELRSRYVLFVINVTSLCCPVFPGCYISAKQLLIKCYKPAPDFASQTTVGLNYLKITHKITYRKIR